jgi:transcriptional regulator with PAS, ATPase and Fis domain
VARAVHAESGRKDGPFVAVNCSALTATLAESTLFGHRRGAFTGAHEDREGLFAQADGGTLFLDEVAELSPDMQARLLRVLEDGEVVPVGGDAPAQVDVRIVAATHRSLREEVAAGRFREDLMFRLRVVPIYLPALRERRTDIEPLIWHFLHREQVASTRVVAQIEPDAMRRLMDHTWPGNVRELKNAVQHAYVVGRGPVLAAKDLPRELLQSRRGVLLPVLGDEAGMPDPSSPAATPGASSPAGTAGPSSPAGTPDVERIRRALASHPGDLSAAARALGVSRTTLWRKRKRFGL